MSQIGIELLLMFVSSFGTLTCDIDSMSEEVRAQFEPVVVKGTFTHTFEQSEFVPKGKKEVWWVYSRSLNELLRESKSSKLHVVVRGMLSPIGRFGHLSSYKRCLARVEIVKVIEKEDSDSD